jgi:hypothetical protein
VKEENKPRGLYSWEMLPYGAVTNKHNQPVWERAAWSVSDLLHLPLPLYPPSPVQPDGALAAMASDPSTAVSISDTIKALVL